MCEWHLPPRDPSPPLSYTGEEGRLEGEGAGEKGEQRAGEKEWSGVEHGAWGASEERGQVNMKIKENPYKSRNMLVYVGAHTSAFFSKGRIGLPYIKNRRLCRVFGIAR